MEPISYRQVRLTGGFWKAKQDMLRKTTVWAVYDRFVETGRFAAFRCDWKEGEPNRPHYFWDSDVAKWMEGAAYLCAVRREPKLEKIVDDTVALIEQNQGADGYFNIYFTVVEPENRFTDRGKHELYCAGHLMEAAVAYYEATGKRRFLDLMCRCADYIYDRFYVRRDTGFTTPGHEEIELALVRLYEATGTERYLTLAKYFIDRRGERQEENIYGFPPNYGQSHLPVRRQTEAVGHAVRATYLYCGMADVASRTHDDALFSACETLFDDITTRKMYVTGGIGATASGEAFGAPYDLPNATAYSESCAAIGLALFAWRMLRFGADGKYGDVIERILYNGFLSSTSLDGRAFFYENPLAIVPELARRDDSVKKEQATHLPLTERQAVFDCSCCPPNIVRFLASLGNLICGEDRDTLYVHQYVTGTVAFCQKGGDRVLKTATRYPENGRVTLTVTGGDARVAVRVPGWCEKPFETVRGYTYLNMKANVPLTLDFGMPARLVSAHPRVFADAGRCAVMRGPVVYCMESPDNQTPLCDIRLDRRAAFHVGKHPTLPVPQLTVRAWRRPAQDALYAVRQDDFVPTTAVLIPYYAFANRGTAAMQVWHLIR